MEIGGIVLNKILSEPSESLESWTKLKNVYFHGEYLTVYSSISKFYDKNSYLPTFNDLLISIRDGLTKSKITALSKLEVPEGIQLELAVAALTDEFAQTETLVKLDKFVDSISLLDAEEIKSEIADILLYLEEKTHSSESIVTMKDISILDNETTLNDLIPLGFNNTFDAEIRSATTELIMVGGGRGAGKSVLATNIITNQFTMGNTALYFSIEMRAREPFNRIMSMLSGVSAKAIRLGNLTEDDYTKLAKTRANFFEDVDSVYNEYIESKDYQKFERSLLEKRLNADNQIIILDNQNVSLMDIDMNIQKYKAQFGDKLKVVVVDYVNQIQIEDIYSWKSQIMLSKGLKDLARKYDIAMITPYQIDASGEARFSKGILDAADMAIKMQANDDHIVFTSTKTRGTGAFELASGVDWDILKILPTDFIIEPEESNNSTEPTNKEDDIPF